MKAGLVFSFVELQQKASSILQMYNSLSTKLTIQLQVFRDMIAKLS